MTLQGKKTFDIRVHRDSGQNWCAGNVSSVCMCFSVCPVVCMYLVCVQLCARCFAGLGVVKVCVCVCV